MLYMIELQFTDENRDVALEYFWQHGTNNYEGKVSIKSLWVATQDRIAFALISAKDPEEVEKACHPFTEFGKVTVRSVVSSDEL